MTYTETETALAKAFDVELRAEIGAADYAEVIRLNRTPKYDCACASHDFCDANLTMLAAYRTLMGRDFPEGDEETEGDMTLWNYAWSAWREMTA